MNTYTGLHEDQGERIATFAAPYPGDMVLLDLVAGEELVAARCSYLASSLNVTVTGNPVTRDLPDGIGHGFDPPKNRLWS